MCEALKGNEEIFEIIKNCGIDNISISELIKGDNLEPYRNIIIDGNTFAKIVCSYDNKNSKDLDYNIEVQFSYNADLNDTFFYYKNALHHVIEIYKRYYINPWKEKSTKGLGKYKKLRNSDILNEYCKVYSEKLKTSIHFYNLIDGYDIYASGKRIAIIEILSNEKYTYKVKLLFENNSTPYYANSITETIEYIIRLYKAELAELSKPDPEKDIYNLSEYEEIKDNFPLYLFKYDIESKKNFIYNKEYESIGFIKYDAETKFWYGELKNKKFVKANDVYNTVANFILMYEKSLFKEDSELEITSAGKIGMGHINMDPTESLKIYDSHNKFKMIQNDSELIIVSTENAGGGCLNPDKILEVSSEDKVKESLLVVDTKLSFIKDVGILNESDIKQSINTLEAFILKSDNIIFKYSRTIKSGDEVLYWAYLSEDKKYEIHIIHDLLPLTNRKGFK